MFRDLEMEEQPDEMDPGGAGAAEKGDRLLRGAAHMEA